MYSLRRRLSEISQGQWKFSCDNLNSLASLGVALNHSCWAENYSFGLLVCFWHRISCNLGWLQTSVTPAFTSRVQGLQVCTSTPCLRGLVDGTPGLYELPNEPRLQLRLKWSCWLTAWPSHPPTLQSAKNCMPWGGFLSQAGKVSSSSAPMPCSLCCQPTAMHKKAGASGGVLPSKGGKTAVNRGKRRFSREPAWDKSPFYRPAPGQHWDMETESLENSQAPVL